MSSLQVTKSSLVFFLHLLSIMSNTSAVKKATIVTRKEMGMPDQEIANKENIAPSTISQITTCYGKTHQFDAKKPKPGCPNKMSEQDIHFACRMISTAKAKKATDLKRKFFPSLHIDIL